MGLFLCQPQSSEIVLSYVADSSEATGLKWATPASGGMTLLATKTFNNTDFTASFTSIAGTYKNLLVVGSGLQTSASGNESLALRLNNDTGSNYSWGSVGCFGNGSAGFSGTTTTSQTVGLMGWTGDTSARFGNFQIFINDYASTIAKSIFTSSYADPNGINWLYQTGLIYNSTTAITRVDVYNGNSVNVKAGTIKIYGVS